MKKKETFKKEDSTIRDYIKKITDPIFNRVLKDNVSDSMTTIKPSKKIMWRPNNYRRQINVKTKTDSTINYIKRTITTINFNEHTKLISLKYKGVTLQYGKNTLTGICSQNIINGFKETYLIEANSISDIEERITQKKEEIKKKIDEAIFSFARKFNIVLPFNKPKWSRYEDWIKGEDYIDKIPREVIIHDTYFKKVYTKGIEFKSTGKGEEPTAHLKNYIVNRAVENIAPEISKEMSMTRNTMKEIYKDVGSMITGMRPILTQITNLNKGFTELNKDITELKQQQQPLKPHVSKELIFLFNNIKTSEDILKYRQQVILLNKNEKRILEDYLLTINS